MARKSDHSVTQRIVDDGSSSEGDQEDFGFRAKSKSYLRPRNLNFQQLSPKASANNVYYKRLPLDSDGLELKSLK